MEADTVKSKIVVAADKFFSHFGFHKTTMDEIAKKIHKAKGALYYYFRSKEELYNEVLKQELDSVKSQLREITRKGNNPVETLEDYVKLRLELLSKAKNYHETLKADFTERYSFVDDVRKNFDEFEHSQFIYILSIGKEKGFLKISDIDSTSNLILILLKSLDITLFLQDKYEDYNKTIDELISLLSSGLKKKP